MSTILKALRRLEEEKSRGGSSRPLREEVASGPGEAPRRRMPWLPLVAMVVGAGLGASAWWFWPYERGGEPVREASAGDAAQGVEPSVMQRIPGFDAAAAKVESKLLELAEAGLSDDAADATALRPEALPGAGGPPEDAFASPVEVVERPVPELRIAAPAPGGPQQRVIQDPAHVANEPPAATARRARRAAERAARRAEASAQAPTRFAAATPDPVTDPVTDPVSVPRDPVTDPAPPVEQAVAPKPRAAEPPAPKPAPREAQPAPPRETKPAPARTAKKSAPAAVSPASDADSAVRVKRTQWHPEPARRSAQIDVSGKSESVHEGDVVGEYVVTEIRPSGVVLSRDGQRIERGIGK